MEATPIYRVTCSACGLGGVASSPLDLQDLHAMHVAEGCPMPSRQELMDALETAWTLLCNVGEGEWAEQTQEWEQAAIRFRDTAYHPLLSRWVEAARGREAV